jgi:hypothetical protein
MIHANFLHGETEFFWYCAYWDMTEFDAFFHFLAQTGDFVAYKTFITRNAYFTFLCLLIDFPITALWLGLRLRFVIAAVATLRSRRSIAIADHVTTIATIISTVLSYVGSVLICI